MSSSVSNSKQNPPWYLSAFAGSLGQTAELVAGGHVLNRIATHQQAHPSKASFLRSIKHIHSHEGFRGFYAGLNWNLVQCTCKGATRWGLNNKMFIFFGEHIPKEIQQAHPWTLPISVGLVGALFETTIYLCPTESLKTRTMTHGWENFAGMRQVIYQEGPSIFFRGWTRLYARQAITWATYLTVYDKYRLIFIRYRKGDPVTRTDKFVMNVLTGSTASLLNTPFDMLRTQAQKHSPLEERRLIPALKSVLNTHGMRGVYRSLPTRMMRSSFYSVFTFTIMDYFNALPARMKV